MAAPPHRFRYSRYWAIATGILILFGIGLRVIHLDHRFYWGDEVMTSLRMSGYTEVEIIQEQYTALPIPAANLKQYQLPQAERTLGDAIATLAQHPEHPPLYYLGVRFWAQFWHQWFDDPVAIARSFSVLFGLLGIPAAYWFAQELLPSSRLTWAFTVIVAISPLHILFSQEARQYSVWTLLILLSSGLLCRACRQARWAPWGWYSLTVGLGLYTHLLFGLVVVAHGVYVLAAMKGDAWRVTWTSGVSRFLGAIALAVASFTPWLWIVVTRPARVNEVLSLVEGDRSILDLLETWVRGSNRVFFNADLTWGNWIWVGFLVYALYQVGTQAPKPASILICGLVGTLFLGLMVPDLVSGNTQSTRIRYLIPFYIGLQWAIAYLFDHQLSYTKGWKKKLWQTGFGIIVLGSMIGSIVASSQIDVPWINTDKVKDYVAIADAIQAYPNTLVMSDTSPGRMITLSDALPAETTLLLVPPSSERLQELDIFLTPLQEEEWRSVPIQIPDTILQEADNIVVFDSSDMLNTYLEKSLNIRLKPIVSGDSFTLLQASPRLVN
jgi:uncharacterized membrane protein